MKLTKDDILVIKDKVIKNDDSHNIEIPDFGDDICVLYDKEITIEVINGSLDNYFLNEQYIKSLDINNFIPFTCMINTKEINYYCYNCVIVSKEIGTGINIYTISCAKIERIRIK